MFWGLLVLLIFFSSRPSLALNRSCVVAIERLHQIAASPQPLRLAPAESMAIRAELFVRYRPYIEEFKKLLHVNGLKISGFSKEGLPLLTSLEFPEVATSIGVMAELNRHELHIEKEHPELVNGHNLMHLQGAVDALLERFRQDRSIEFHTHNPRFELFLDLEYGVFVGMREVLSQKVLLVAIANGSEALNLSVVKQALYLLQVQ